MFWSGNIPTAVWSVWGLPTICPIEFWLPLWNILKPSASNSFHTRHWMTFSFSLKSILVQNLGVKRHSKISNIGHKIVAVRGMINTVSAINQCKVTNLSVTHIYSVYIRYTVRFFHDLRLPDTFRSWSSGTQKSISRRITSKHYLQQQRSAIKMAQRTMKMTLLEVPHCLTLYFDPKPDLIYNDKVLVCTESCHVFTNIKRCCQHDG